MELVDLSDGTRPATAADVAALAGVSRATVSHILNGRDERFPEHTRARVRAAAERLDYRPSPAGRSLVRGRGDTIVVLIPNISVGSRMQEALERLAEQTTGLQSNVVLRFAGDDSDATADAVLKLRPLAVVDFGALTIPARARLLAHGVPTVPELERPFTAGGIPLDHAIAELQVAELVARGPRRILFGAVPEAGRNPLSTRRLEALRTACARRGLPAPVAIDLVPVLVDAVAVLRAELPFGPVGVAGYNDIAALTVLSAARELDVAVPGQVSVVGVDRTDIGQLWKPRLTTVDVDIRVLMDAAARDVRTILDGTIAPDRPALDDALHLVEGEST